MSIYLFDKYGDYIRPNADGSFCLAPSDDNWEIYFDSEPTTVFAKIGRTSYQLSKGTRGFQLDPQYRKLAFGQLSLFQDRRCTQQLADLSIMPSVLDEADFEYLLGDIHRLAIDAKSPFRSLLELADVMQDELELLGRLASFLSQFKIRIGHLFASFQEDLKPSITDLPRRQAERRLHPALLERIQPTSSNLHLLVRAPSHGDANHQYLASIVREVITFTRVAEEEIVRLFASEHQRYQGLLLSIRREVRDLEILVATIRSSGQVQRATPDLLLDANVKGILNLWKSFQEAWGTREPQVSNSLPRRGGSSSTNEIEMVGIAKTSTLYERWFACLFFNELSRRGFELADKSPTPYDMFRLRRSEVGLEIEVADESRTRPIQLFKEVETSVLSLSIWVDPFVRFTGEYPRYQFSSVLKTGCFHPDLFVCANFQDSDYWVAIDCKFLLTDRLKRHRSDLKKKYLFELKSDFCWMIHPRGPLVNNWSKFRRRNEPEATHVGFSRNFSEAVIKASSDTFATLDLFFFNFFETIFRKFETCWGCGDTSSVVRIFGLDSVRRCRACGYSWSLESCMACGSPFLASLRNEKLKKLSPSQYAERHGFHCPCGDNRSYVNTTEVGRHNRYADQALGISTGGPNYSQFKSRKSGR